MLPHLFRLPQRYSFTSLEDTLEVVKAAKTPDWEGLVIQGSGDNANQLVKLKSPLYVRRLALVKGLSPKHILRSYVRGGWDAIRQLASGVEEVLLKTSLAELLSDLQKAEQRLQAEIASYRDVPPEAIQGVPPSWRWVIGYRDKKDKFEQAFRKSVVDLMENTTTPT